MSQEQRAVARKAAAQQRADAWLERHLAASPPLTDQQQRDLRRVLLPARPLARPA